MKFSILLPHYKTAKMTLYAVHQILAMQGKHEVELIVVDNNAGDGSIDSVYPFADVKILQYPLSRLQSHGISFDWVIEGGHVSNEWFITVESDSFPTNSTWLDYYEDLIKGGYVAAASVLKLSGGVYGHPAGALYNMKVFKEAMTYAKSIPYYYVPNLAMKENFPCHCMIRKHIWQHFLKNPVEYIEPKLTDPNAITAKRLAYLPTCGVFHNGMGGLQEYLSTFGSRTIHTDPPHIILTESHADIIHRMGYEPGQWFWYWMIAMKKKIFSIPTMVQWLPNRFMQNQEFTKMVNGFTHLWGVSSYHKADIVDMRDVVDFKRKQVDDLYDSLPNDIKPRKELI